MNEELWNKILAFDLDWALSQYGFNTRLENENLWTTAFARDAIVEYKKFMYLAATSAFMVSPSEIVDIVWHQHLIFTQSYDDFCKILGKKIVHIPSTHQSSDFAKFREATERTRKLYGQSFGKQPPEFWGYDDIYGPLQLNGARYSINQIIITGSFALLILIAIGYVFLYPIYVTIENPNFLFGYAFILTCAIACLHLYNQARFSQIVKAWDKSAFIFKLSALELICLSKNKIYTVIDGVVNRLILEEKIDVLSGNLLKVNGLAEPNNILELCVIQTILAAPDNEYKEVQKTLAHKPAFNKTTRAIDGFNDYFIQSTSFITLFIINFSILAVLFVLGAVRLIIGVERGRPIEFILITMLACFFLMSRYLKYLTTAIGSVALSKYYRNNILPDNPESEQWDWQYFLLENAVFASAFIPLVTSSGNSFGSGNNTGGSSCGSGGGGGGGCGGCGGGN